MGVVLLRMLNAAMQQYIYIAGELLITTPKGPCLGWVKVTVNSCKIVTKSANSLPISLERQVWSNKGV